MLNGIFNLLIHFPIIGQLSNIYADIGVSLILSKFGQSRGAELIMLYKILLSKVAFSRVLGLGLLDLLPSSSI